MHDRGRLSGRIKALRDRLADVAALVELSLDFSDQDVEGTSTDEIRERLLGVRDELTTLSACGERGRLPGHAVTAVLFGPPNAGKSSLFNALLRRHEAIVSPEPGTTRDVLEAELVAGAMRLRLIDTAGLHRPGSDVEALAVGHSTDAIRSADVDLCVLDASRPPDRDGREALRMADPERTLLLLNKCDLNLAEETVRAAEGSGLTWLRVSSVTSEGLDALLEHMRERIGRDATYRHPDAVMLNARQFELLSAAIEAIRRVLDLATEETVGELAASDIHDALDAVSRITGDRVAEDILDRVFANFCIGK